MSWTSNPSSLTFGSGLQSTTLDHVVPFTQLPYNAAIFLVNEDNLSTFRVTMRALRITLTRLEVAWVVRRQLFFCGYSCL